MGQWVTQWVQRQTAATTVGEEWHLARCLVENGRVVATISDPNSVRVRLPKTSRPWNAPDVEEG